MNDIKGFTFKTFFHTYAPLFAPHRGKMIGMLFGAFIGLAVLIFGFWQTLFVLLCAFVGLIVGIRIDHGIRPRDVEDFFKDLFPYRYKQHSIKESQLK